MANFEAGTAYVGLVPSAKGFSKEAKKALAAAGDLNKQVDLEADTKQLEQAIREVKAHLKALDREKATPSIDFDKSVAEARITEVQAKLDELGRKEATPRVNVDIARARQELNTLERQLEQINARRAEVNVDADISQAQTALASLEAKLAEVGRQKTEPKVTADTSTAQQRLTELDGRLASLAGKRVEPKVELAIAQAQQEALRIRAELERLGAMSPNVQVNADIASASAKLAAINAQLQNLDGKTANVNINSMSASQATLILMGVVAALGAIGAAAPAAVAALAAVGGAVGGIGQGVGAALMGFSGIGDALKALEQDEKSAATSSSASSATRAAGAKQVESAQRALQQAQVSADRAAITGAQQVQDAQRSLQQASVSAARAQIQAQEQVAAARRQVADAAVSAAQRVQSAEASLASAQRSRQYAQESLTRATQDAIRANRDLQMSVSGAALSEERASLSLAQARERLAKSTSTNPLERADLELSVREAEQQLKETQVRYGDLRSEQSQWAKSGVQGSQQVVAAQRALQDANRGVADAQRGLTDAQVSGARQVADAQASLAKAQRDAAWQQQDSQRAVADAQRGVSRAVQQAAWQQQDAARQVADAQRALAESYVQGGETASASSKKAALALSELTPAGRSMVQFLRSEWQPTWKRTSDAVADVMLPKVERSLRNLLALEPLVRAGLVDAGSVIGDLAVKGSQLATSPAFRQDFATIMASNNRQLENYGDASISLFGAFTDLYSVAGPVSERFSRLVANSMEAFESFIIGKRATGELEEYLQRATDALMFVGGWLVDVSVDVYQLATALAPLGVGLLEVVRYITDLVAWAAQLSPELTSITAAALIGAIALSKFGKAIAVGGAITNTIGGVRTAAGALNTVFNPAALAATATMQKLGDGTTTAAKKIGLSEGAATKFGAAARGIGSSLPLVGAAIIGLAVATDVLTASASEAASGLEQGGAAAEMMRQKIADQNGVVGENASGVDRLNQSVNEWIGNTTGLWATQQSANEELERSRAAMSNLERAQSLATEAQGNYEQALRDFGAASPEATAALQALEGRSRDVEIAQIALREKVDLATAAMIWQRDEQLASLDANLRKRQADSQLADAQQRLADTIRDHGAGSREAADAQLDLEMAQSRAAAAAKESAGGQQAYNEAIGKMVADTKGPLSETLVGLVRTLDGAGLAAAGAKVQINDAGVAVATFPNGKTVTLDAQNAPTFFTNLQAAKAAVDSTKGTIGVDADPGVGVQKLGNFKLAVDQTTGVVKMDGDISPADADRLGIKAKTDGTTGTMWINGNPVNCDGSLNGMRVKVDQTTGVMTIDGDPAKANQKGQAAKDGISNPATQPVITPRVDPDPALEALKTWWGKVQEWFGRNPITPAGPAPNHTGVQNPNRGRYAAGGLVEGYASGGAISHKQVIRGYPTGGRVRGPGTATSDSIPAMLSNGEYVIRASSVAKLGVPLLNRLNAFAAGGPVGLAGGGMPAPGASVSTSAVAVPSVDPRATAASAAATSMLAQSMQAAASAAGVLRPSLAGVQAGQQALVSAGVAPLAGAITGPLNTALGLYQQQVGVQVPAANAALQGAQALTRASTAVTAANTAAASAQMAGAVTGMSAQAQAQHAGLRAGQVATQVSTNQTAANTAVNSAGMSSSVTGMSAVSQAQHSFLRQSQGQTVVANNTLAANTTMNTGRMSGDNAVMSATVQGHLQNVRGSQGTTVASTTAFADAWRAQLARTQPDSGNPLRWVINYPIRSITDAWNNLDAQFALGKKVNPYIPNFATGGRVSGPGGGTDDKVPAMLSNGEFVVREAITSRVQPFLRALNAGQPEAMQAASAGKRPHSMVRLATGGSVSDAIARATQVARSMSGKPYVWGGFGPGGADCCIIGGVRVYGDFGAKPISEIKQGDRVFSHVDGKLTLNTVTAAWQSKTQPVFKVRTRNRAVTASANHPFLRLAKTTRRVVHREDADWPGLPTPGAARGGECMVSTCSDPVRARGLCVKHGQRHRAQGDPRLWSTRSTVYEPEWCRLDELQPGDLLVQPKEMRTGYDVAPALSDDTPVTEDIAWLVGALVGDGTVYERRLALCLFGADRERAAEILERTWSCSHAERSASSGIRFASKQAATALADLGLTHRGSAKRVPDAVWNWSTDLQRAFLDGYCDADGHRPANPTRHGDRTYHSASRELIEDVRAMHIMLGDPASNITVTKRTKPITIKGKLVKNALDQHAFAVWPRPGRGEGVLRNNAGVRGWLDSAPEFTVARVLDITDEGVQDTYDLTVEDAHNFVADGVVVHNSGFQSIITNALRGEANIYRRIGTTGTFPWSGFTPGLTSMYSIGAFKGSPGHMAGTLAGTNVESGGSPSRVKYGAGAVGADNGQFNVRASLPVVGGKFMSGGAGGGGFDPTPAIEEAFKKVYAEVADVTRFFGGSPQVVRDQGVARVSADRVKAHAVEKAAAMFASMGGTGAGVEQWRGVVLQALGMVGQAPSLADTTLRRMQQESGGNPRAINDWDSNARRGTPSKGLMQVIDPTFRSNWDPRTPNDIWNPLSNVVASMHYTLRRYGSLPAGYNRAGGYDNGGLLMPGRTLVENRTGVPERVLDNVETRSYDTLTRLVGKNGVKLTLAEPGSGGPTIGTLNAVVPQGATVNDMARAVTFEVRRTKRGGVYSRG